MKETTVRVHMNDDFVSERHNARDYDIVKYEKHIDTKDGVHEVWKDGTTTQTYNYLFADEIDTYNAKQKRKDRKIDGVKGYMEQVKNDDRGRKKRKKKNGKLVVENTEENGKKTERKGKRLVYEVVVGAGNTNLTKDENGLFIYSNDGHEVHMQRLPYEVNYAATREFFADWDRRNTHFQLVRVDWHADEFYINESTRVKEWATEHAHGEFVPWADGYKQGLSVQQSMNKALEQMGFKDGEVVDETGKKVWKCAYTQWLDREREVYEKCVAKAYYEYCDKNPDYYEENGDLRIVYPFKGKNAENMLTEKFRDVQRAEVILDSKRRSTEKLANMSNRIDSDIKEKKQELDTVQKQIEDEKAAWAAEQARAREALRLQQEETDNERVKAEEDKMKAKADKENAAVYKEKMESEYKSFKEKIKKITEQIVQKQIEVMNELDTESVMNENTDNVSTLATAYRKKMFFPDKNGKKMSVEAAYQYSIRKATEDIKQRRLTRQEGIRESVTKFNDDVKKMTDDITFGDE